MGPFIQDPDHRDRVGVLDAGGEIEFAGHGHDRLRPLLDDDPSRQGPARGHGDIDLMLLCKLDQFLDFTFSATLAVLDIACNLDLTVKILNAVREEDQQSTRPGAVVVRSDEMIVELDKGLLNLDLRHSHQPPHQDHERKKDLRHETPEPLRKKDVLSQQNGDDEQQALRKA